MGCGLRREVEDMLSLARRSGDVKLVMRRYPSQFIYALERMSSVGPLIVGSGIGKTKREALENLLACWRRECTLGIWNGIECPAQSSEELKIKMDLLRDGAHGEDSND